MELRTLELWRGITIHFTSVPRNTMIIFIYCYIEKKLVLLNEISFWRGACWHGSIHYKYLRQSTNHIVWVSVWQMFSFYIASSLFSLVKHFCWHCSLSDWPSKPAKVLLLLQSRNMKPSAYLTFCFLFLIGIRDNVLGKKILLMRIRDLMLLQVLLSIYCLLFD